jgi:hypothetical protein
LKLLVDVIHMSEAVSQFIVPFYCSWYCYFYVVFSKLIGYVC